MEWLRRRWAAWKLQRGRCANCDAALRDDASDPYCSDECARAHQDKVAW